MANNEDMKRQLLMSIGNNIRRIRKSKNMTQAELAFKLNADTSKIGRTERGEYDFKISSLLVIANGLDIRLSDIINFESQ